jgi:hypothetical protein
MKFHGSAELHGLTQPLDFMPLRPPWLPYSTDSAVVWLAKLLK